MERSVHHYSKTTYLILCALFAALTAVGAWISIPLPFTPVPVTLATMVTSLAGGLLGPRYGSMSMVVYVLLGAAGAPFFHNFTGGAGIIAGPTGGYIVGYIFSALICGILIDINKNRKQSFLWIVLSITAGLFACYLLGTLWFIMSTGTGLVPSILMCVVPFLPGDALKIIASALLIKKLRPVIFKRL